MAVALGRELLRDDPSWSDPLRWAHSPLQISRACMPTVIATGSALMRAYDTGARRYVNSILSLMHAVAEHHTSSTS